MRSAKAKKAARKHRNRPPSALRPNSRRTRNHDQRGKDFMAWCKTLPCVRCNRFAYRKWVGGLIDLEGPFPMASTFESEFAHFGGNLAAKSSNRNGLPLCAGCHRFNPGCHEEMKKRWAAYWDINVPAIIQRLNERFDRLFPLATSTIDQPPARSGRSPEGTEI